MSYRYSAFQKFFRKENYSLTARKMVVRHPFNFLRISLFIFPNYQNLCDSLQCIAIYLLIQEILEMDKLPSLSPTSRFLKPFRKTYTSNVILESSRSGEIKRKRMRVSRMWKENSNFQVDSVHYFPEHSVNSHRELRKRIVKDDLMYCEFRVSSRS